MSKEKKTLQSLVAQANFLAERLMEADGELDPETESALTVNEKDLAVKVDSYAIIIDRFEMEAAYLKSKADQFRAAAKVIENAKDRLRENVKLALETLKITEISGTDYKFKLQKSRPKLIIDERILPDSYKTQVISYEADKEKIQEALLAGLSVQGASLLGGQSLRKVVAKGKS